LVSRAASGPAAHTITAANSAAAFLGKVIVISCWKRCGDIVLFSTQPRRAARLRILATRKPTG
jgi:hypothetical protein